MRSIVVLIALLALALPLGAQQLADPVPEPPPMPEGVEIEEGMEPEVMIERRGDTVEHHYHVNGRVFMVRVTPPHGVPYYLVDHDGDGEMVRHDSRPNLSVPMWAIHSW